MNPPITENPQAFEKFKSSATRGYFRDAFLLLHDHTIDEQSIRDLSVPNLLDEVRLFARSYEPQIGRKILIATSDAEALPSVLTHQRAAYQLSHFDMLEDFSRCLQVLERFGVRVPRDIITSELAEWARGKSAEPLFAERIARHFDLEIAQ